MTKNRHVKALIVQLRSSNSKNRQKAANQLASMGEEAQEAIGALAQVLQSDEDKAVRGVASFALSQMGEPAVETLIALLKEKSLRMKVLKALRKIGTPSALEAVAQYES